MNRPVALVGAVALGSLAVAAVLQVTPVGGTPTVERAAENPSADRAPAPSPVVDPAALRLLQRGARAQSAVAYTGTQYLSAWAAGRSQSHVLRVDHSPDDGTTWRDAGTARAPRSAHRPAGAAEPSLLGVDEVALLARHYSLAVAGAGRVAGRPVDVVVARLPGGAPDDASVAARFWLDRATGLVLRREVYDRRGRVIRASAYVDLTVDAARRPATTVTGGGGAWPEALGTGAVHRLRRDGWHCPSALPGPLPLVDARRGGPGGDIVHFSYADGIASISVFEQPGRLDVDRLVGYRRVVRDGSAVWVHDGVPRRVVWSSGGSVVTVVGDAPPRTVDRAVDALHAGASARGGETVERLGRGLDRVASWFNPFE